MKSKGFTLIELLVVIAIIGILASVVLASLNSARARGVDTAIKKTLGDYRTQAQNYYDSHGNYGAPGALVFGSTPVICSTSGTLFDPLETSNINLAIIAAEELSGGPGWDATCAMSANGNEWAVSVPLKTNNTLSWCADSRNANKQITGALPANTTYCP